MPQLTYDEKARAYVFHCEINERMPAKEAGFEFNRPELVPMKWATKSARRALKLAAHADDETRERIAREAAGETDPDAPWLEKDGPAYRWYAPARLNSYPKQAGFSFSGYTDRDMRPWPKGPHWASEDPMQAINLLRAAQADGLEVQMRAELRESLRTAFTTRQEAIRASRAEDADIAIPAPGGLAYLPYQKAGIAFCMNRTSALIGDDMGLGKTIQGIGLVNTDEVAERVLVICPASLKINWKREFEKWLTRPLTVGLATMREVPPTNVVICNYEILGETLKDDDKPPCTRCRHSFAEHLNHEPDQGPEYWQRGRHFYLTDHQEPMTCHCREYAAPKKAPTKRLRPELCEETWDILIVDEAHRLKNPKAQRTQFALSIPAARSIFLTGTPIPNRPRELWPLLHHLDPVNFSNERAFLKRYCLGRGSSFGNSYDGASNLDELQERMRASVMIRRLKKDVLKELPPKRRQIIEFAAEGARQQKLIAQEQEAERQLEALRERLRRERDEALARVQIAKAAADPSELSEAEAAYKNVVERLREGVTAAFSELSRLRHETALSKLPQVQEHLEAILEEHPKVIVMGWHKDVLETLREKFGPDRSVIIHGEIAMDDRDEAVTRFQTDPSCQIFFGNINAAGVGLTLTAAPIVVFVELDWVPGNITQAEDRAHRIGQTADFVLIQHLVLEGSLDAKMAKTLVRKQEVADQALDRRTKIETDTFDVEAGAEMVAEEIVLPEQLDYSMPGSRSREARELPSTYRVTREELQAVARTLWPEDVVLIHGCIRKLQAACDGASSEDNVGFRKCDVRIGHFLAHQDKLTPLQAALGREVIRTYRRTQLAGMADRLFTEKEAKDGGQRGERAA